MLLFEGGDDLLVLVAGGDGLVDLLAHPRREARQVTVVDDEVRSLAELVENGDRARRVFGVHQIVRDVHREPLCRDPSASGRELDQGGEAGGHVDAVDGTGTGLDHRGIGGVGCDQQVAGVRRRPRDGLQADGLAHLVVLGEFDDTLHDLLPAEVGLRTVDHEEGLGVLVPEQVEHDAWQVDVAEVVTVEGHDRPTGAVVVDVVDAKFGDGLMGQRRDDVRHRLPDAVPGVHEPGEGVDHRQVLGDLRHVDRHAWVHVSVNRRGGRAIPWGLRVKK